MHAFAYLPRLLRNCSTSSSSRPAPLHLVLYTASACSLCGRFKADLSRFLQRPPERAHISIQEVDISTAPRETFEVELYKPVAKSELCSLLSTFFFLNQNPKLSQRAFLSATSLRISQSNLVDCKDELNNYFVNFRSTSTTSRCCAETKRSC